jgi:uncharacterized membrane protein (DUF4010 family)
MIEGAVPWADQALALLTALAAGLLVGVERGWKLKEQKPGHRVAGVRTFSLLGMVGGIAGLLGAARQPLIAAILAAGATAVLVTAYARELRARHDSTSAVAALATLAIGFLAGMGSPGLASACAAAVVLLLAMRGELHGFVERLGEEDVKALARFAVIALGVLPLLPNRDMGPLDAWNPQKLWLVVVLVTGFSFAGYIANRLFGSRWGTTGTALIGGAYSSTAVTASLAQRLGTGKGGGPEPAGIALATAVMFVRILILVGVLATAVWWPFVVVIAPALLVAFGAGGILWWRCKPGDSPEPPGNPIKLLPALTFMIFVAAAAVAVRWAEGRFGEQGIAALVLATGSFDVDVAIVTVGRLKPGAIAPALAALALAGTVVANMAVKIGITLAYARGKGLTAALALGASMAALMASIGVGWFLR